MHGSTSLRDKLTKSLLYHTTHELTITQLVMTTSSPQSRTMLRRSVSQCNLLKVEHIYIDPKKAQQGMFSIIPYTDTQNTLDSTDLIVRVEEQKKKGRELIETQPQLTRTQPWLNRIQPQLTRTELEQLCFQLWILLLCTCLCWFFLFCFS